MPNNTSGFGKMRTMAEDMKKAGRPSEEKTSSRQQLEKIMDGADGGEQNILKDLKSSVPHKEKRSSSLGALLPIEESTGGKPPIEESTGGKLPIEESTGGKPPTNLPGIPKTKEPVTKAKAPEVRIEDITLKPKTTPIKPDVPETPEVPEIPKVPEIPTKPKTPEIAIEEIQEEPKIVLPKSDLATKPTGGEDLDGKPAETPEELLTLSAQDSTMPPSSSLEDVRPKATPAKAKPYKFIAMLSGIFFVAALLGFSYWNFFVKESTPEQIVQPPSETIELTAPHRR